MPKEEKHFIFLCATGIVALAGKGLEVRTPGQIPQDTEKGEEHRSDPLGETDQPDSAKQRQEQNDLEAKHDFWTISDKSYMCLRKGRQTQHWTNLRKVQFCDYWNVDGDRQLSGPRTGFTQCTALDYCSTSGIHAVRGEIDTDESNVQAREHRSLVEHVEEISAKRKQRWAKIKAEVRQCTTAESDFFF